MKGVRRRFPRSMNSAVMERMTRGGDSNKGNLEKGEEEREWAAFTRRGREEGAEEDGDNEKE